MNTRSSETSVVRNYLPSDTVSCHRRLQFVSTPL